MREISHQRDLPRHCAIQLPRQRRMGIPEPDHHDDGHGRGRPGKLRLRRFAGVQHTDRPRGKPDGGDCERLGIQPSVAGTFAGRAGGPDRRWDGRR